MLKRVLLTSCLLWFIAGSGPVLECAGKRPLYAVVERPAPVLNTPDFRSVFGGADGRTLKTDAQGLVREVEFIPLPGTVLTIEGSLKSSAALIYKVRTSDYPAPSGGLFIDSRFVRVLSGPPAPRPRKLPPKQKVLQRMLIREGAPYVWGGNDSRGVPELLEYYPPRGKISPLARDRWTLKGLDCSGLLYEATDGFTPRNTSDLIMFGSPVPIQGMTAREIAGRLKPLDLIVWKGHVIIVLDGTRTIESCLGCSARGGVTVRGLGTVLREVMSKRVPVNRYDPAAGNSFVVRRWYA